MPEPAFQYPGSVLDQPAAILSALGSLWATTYSGDDLITALCAAKAAQAKQSYNDGTELIRSLSRQQIPVLHTDLWYSLTLAQSALNESQYTLAKFGPNNGFLFGGNLQFGVPQQQTLFAFPLPSPIVNIPLIFNRISAPSVTLVNGIDYIIQDGFIVFRANPFNNELIPQATVFADGAAVDATLVLWCFRAQEDRQYVYEQFGYVLGVQLPSSEDYKELVNALFDALVSGSTANVVRDVWSAVTGVKLAAGNETVEQVIYDADRTLVITSLAVYRYDPSATVLVTVGQALDEGDAITDAVQFFEFNQGQCPPEIMSLALGQGMLASGFFSDLVFQNTAVPLLVETDVDGYTKVSFEVGGWPADVEMFFDDLHSRGVARGYTLANLLDQRPQAARDTQPTAGALPATINPFCFLCQNVLRNNAFLLQLKTSACQAGVGVNAAKFLRRVIPPQTVMLVLAEVELGNDTVIMSGPGDAQGPGYTEEIGTFVCMNYEDTVDPSLLVTESLRFNLVGGRCI